MRNQPKVSIIVPVYNVENYLEQCINSLKSQTLNEIEIILVNDGSTDSSGQICVNHEKEDARIKVVHKKNGGLSDARNLGLSYAKGEYITFVDSDDWINPDTCRYAYDQAKLHNVDLVFWGRIKEYPTFSQKGKTLFFDNTLFEGESIKWLHRRMYGLFKDELKAPTTTDAINSAWGKLYSSDIILSKKIEFRDTKEIGSEDVLFNIQLMKYVRRALFVKKYFSHYRKDNPNSLTRNHRSTLFNRYLNLFAAIDSNIHEEKLGDEYREALKNRISLSIINVSLSISSPINKIPISQKLQDIDKVLTHPLYKESIANFDIHYLPYHWKVFFTLCKWEISWGVYLTAKIMRKLR